MIKPFFGLNYFPFKKDIQKIFFSRQLDYLKNRCSHFIDTQGIALLTGDIGSGKTTLANAILGFISLNAGQILFQGRDIAALDRRQRLEYRRQVQAVFQDPYEVYNPFYRVGHIFNLVVNRFKLAGNKNQARELIEDALKVAPGASHYRDTLGWILFLQGNTKDASFHLRASIKGLTNSPEAHYHLGMVERKVGNLDLARCHLEAAVKLEQTYKEKKKTLDPGSAQAIDKARQVLKEMDVN